MSLGGAKFVKGRFMSNNDGLGGNVRDDVRLPCGNSEHSNHPGELGILSIIMTFSASMSRSYYIPRITSRLKRIGWGERRRRRIKHINDKTKHGHEA